MNKDELIDAVHELSARYHIPLSHMVVGFGGAMVLLGLRDQTNDVDIDVPAELYAFLRAKGYPERPITNALGGFTLKVGELFDVRESPYGGRRKVYVISDEGIFHHCAEVVLENKLVLNREKDQEDIRKLKTYLSK